MARLFPFRSEPSTQDGQPRVVDLEGEDADAVFGALSSTTARQIYARLDEEPGTPSDIAEAIDSSIQNVRYHLEKLEDAGLVEVVDTWYSSRGNEMSVYGTSDGPLIVTSDKSTASQLKTALSRLIGGIGALAGGSLLVQYGLTRYVDLDGAGSPPPAADDPEPTGTAETDDEQEPQDPGDDSETSPDDPADTFEDDEVTAEEVPEADESDTTDSADVDSADDAVDDDAVDDDAAADAIEEDADAAGESDPEADDGADLDTEYDIGENATDGGFEAAEAAVGTIPPGLLFFCGGLVVLVAVTIYWYWHRPSY